MSKKMIPLGISNRHLHVSRADLETLFGKGYELKPMRWLRQTGQYAAEECVTIEGPKGKFENVRILGPERKATQVEVSQSDSFKLGVKPPVRDSGDLKGSPTITITGPKGKVTIPESVIIAWRHIHMNPTEAKDFNVKDKDFVMVRAGKERAVIFDKVLCRVHETFILEMHLDTDEANAAMLKNEDPMEIVNCQC